MSKFQPKHLILGFAILLIVLFIVANLFYSPGNYASGNQAISFEKIWETLKHPIVIIILGPFVGYLFFDKWKSIEKDISDIRNNRDKEVSSLREDLKEQLNLRIDTSLQKTQALDSKVSRIVEDHPWIVSLTDSEYIPSVSSCKIVLLTAKNLRAENKIPTAYEYLYGWLSHIRTDRISALEGNIEDFFELADFCEVDLKDEYLGFKILEEAYINANNKDLFIPEYLKKLVRYGKLDAARSVANSLVAKLHENWWSKVKAQILKKKPPYGSQFAMNAYASLALYEALNGEKIMSKKFLRKAKGLSEQLKLKEDLIVVESELCLIEGDYNTAHNLLREFANSEENYEDIDIEKLNVNYRVFKSRSKARYKNTNRVKKQGQDNINLSESSDNSSKNSKDIFNGKQGNKDKNINRPKEKSNLSLTTTKESEKVKDANSRGLDV